MEAALLLPVLLILIMGIFVIGNWFNDQQVVTAAAREGARIGALTADCRQIDDAVKRSMQAVDTNANHIVIEATRPLPALGGDVWVKVTYHIPFGFDYFKSTYVEVNSTSTYPFSHVVGAATARMEVDPIIPTPPECQ